MQVLENNIYKSDGGNSVVRDYKMSWRGKVLCS